MIRRLVGEGALKKTALLIRGQDATSVLLRVDKGVSAAVDIPEESGLECPP